MRVTGKLELRFEIVAAAATLMANDAIVHVVPSKLKDPRKQSHVVFLQVMNNRHIATDLTVSQY